MIGIKFSGLIKGLLGDLSLLILVDVGLNNIFLWVLFVFL